MAHLFSAVLQPFAAVLLDSIDLSGDLSNTNLIFALMAQSKRGADRERPEVINALCDLLVGIRGEQ
jgi:hypothetical protein